MALMTAPSPPCISGNAYAAYAGAIRGSGIRDPPISTTSIASAGSLVLLMVSHRHLLTLQCQLLDMLIRLFLRLRT